MSATILQIIPELKTGGAEKSVVEMTEAVVREGGRSLVVTEGGALADDVIAKGGKVIEMPVATKNPFKMWLNSRKIAKLIRDENISLVHARSRAPAWSGLWAARAAKVPFVTTYHGAYNQKSALKGFYNGVMARGDWVIANSKFTADLIMGRHKPDPTRLRVIYRGVDVDEIDPNAVSIDRVAALHSAWGIDDEEYKDKKVILHAARLTEWKGQRDVIEAAAELKRQGDERSVFILAGDAQGRLAYETELKELIARDGLETHVKLVGHVSDMAAAYKLADIVVVASREAEAFGRAAAEAQAMGCPVIATDIGAPPEFLNLGKGEAQATAWLVPVADGKAIAGKISTILEFDADELSQMAEIARHYVKETFTTLNMQNQTIEVYEALLGGSLATVSA